MEKNARDKEARYAAERKASERRAELAERLQKIGEEEKKVCWATQKSN
jgi:hypothetical protein